MAINVRTLDRNLGFSYSARGSHFFHRQKHPRVARRAPLGRFCR